MEQNEEKLLDQARQEALRDARRKAEMMAALYGEHVGPALAVGRPGESWGSGGAQLFQTSAGDAEDAEYVSWITPTEVKVEATVFVRFALIRPGDR